MMAGRVAARQPGGNWHDDEGQPAEGSGEKEDLVSGTNFGLFLVSCGNTHSLL